MPGEWDDILGALGLASTGEETAQPSALQSQVAGFPARGANMLMGALGPLGEAGMTLGEMLRTRSLDTRDLPQIAGGVMLGTMAPGGAEAGAAEHGLVTLGKTIAEDTPSLSEAAIEAALAKNPGASIFDIGGHSEMAPKYKMPEPPEPEDYSEHLSPISDWSSLRGQYGPAIFDDISTRERARSNGFNVDLPLYKGGDLKNYPTALTDPVRKSWEKGLFFSPDPQIAATYTLGGAKPLQYVARAQKPVEIDWPSATGFDSYNSSHMGDIIHSARKQGADMLVIRNMEDQGVNHSGVQQQDQYVVLDPSIVRQPGAQFDPQKLSWNELAAGLAGAGAIPALAHETGEEQQ